MIEKFDRIYKGHESTETLEIKEVAGYIKYLTDRMTEANEKLKEINNDKKN